MTAATIDLGRRPGHRAGGPRVARCVPRRLGDRPPRPHPHEAPARAAQRRHDQPDHVRAAVRLRVRRGDPDPRRQLPRVPDGRDLRPDDRVHLLRRCPRPHQRPQEQRRRPLPLAADRQGRSTRRPRHRQHDQVAAAAPDHVAVRPARRLADPQRRPRRRRRLPPADRLRLRHDLGRGAVRQPRQDARGRDWHRLRRAVPADVRGEHVRAAHPGQRERRVRGHDARRPADRRRVEPGDDARQRRAHPVRQPGRRPGPEPAVVDRAPGASTRCCGRSPSSSCAPRSPCAPTTARSRSSFAPP